MATQSFLCGEKRVQGSQGELVPWVIGKILFYTNNLLMIEVVERTIGICDKDMQATVVCFTAVSPIL